MARLRDLPIRVLMGYLADVGEKDARAYALGIAEKNNDSSEISYYGVFPLDKGFVYEVHEGGTARAFAPSILKYFKENSAAHSGDTPLHAVLPASTRRLLVERADEGIHSMLLPETDPREYSPWLTTSVLLAPAVPKRTGVIVTGAIVFSLGMLSMIGAMFTRYTPIDVPPKAVIEKVEYDKTPLSQWPRLLAQAQSGFLVTALLFENDKWEIQTKTQEEEQATAPPALPGNPGGTP